MVRTILVTKYHCFIVELVKKLHTTHLLQNTLSHFWAGRVIGRHHISLVYNGCWFCVWNGIMWINDFCIILYNVIYRIFLEHYFVIYIPISLCFSSNYCWFFNMTKKNSWVANEKQTRHMWNRFEGIGWKFKKAFIIFGQFHTKTATVPRKGYIRESPYVRSTVLCGALKNGVFRYAVPFWSKNSAWIDLPETCYLQE